MEMDEAEDDEEEQHFSGLDLMKIRDAVAVLVQSLLRLLQTFPLKERSQSASNCTQVTIFSSSFPHHATLQCLHVSPSDLSLITVDLQ